MGRRQRLAAPSQFDPRRLDVAQPLVSVPSARATAHRQASGRPPTGRSLRMLAAPPEHRRWPTAALRRLAGHRASGTQPSSSELHPRRVPTSFATQFHARTRHRTWPDDPCNPNVRVRKWARTVEHRGALHRGLRQPSIAGVTTSVIRPDASDGLNPGEH